MISEVHVFAHSIGGGLFLAYGDQQASAARITAFDKVVSAKRRITYDEVVGAEVGSVLTDDLVRPPYATMRTQLMANMMSGATVKLWGCNSTIRNWVYSDDGVVDPNDTNQPYYWRALNERNVPKPSIAKALAAFLGCTVYGASSGSHIEVRYKGHWITSSAYRKVLGHWPSGSLLHRLNPDKGGYDAYTP